MQSNNSILESILIKNDSGFSDKSFLSELTKEYPFFIPAHFFLLQKTDKDDYLYSKQLTKTALLYDNPYWLNFKLQEENNDQNAFITHPQEVDKTTQEAVKATPILSTLVLAEQIENVRSTQNEEKINIPNPTTITNEITTVSPIQNIEEPKFNTENTAADNIATTANNAVELPNKINLATSLKEAENEKELSFEPMHLVDYFASQGIKINDEVLATDKLSKQLKSFTEWLKTMKKINVTPSETISTATDISIQHLAEKSNNQGEIVTETMAEVFTQQGMRGKAKEVYKKLSLLNPSKSAYFAAKIEQLNGL